MRSLTYAEAIREALEQAMKKDPSVLLIGEGVPDPKGIFGTTLGLQEKFGTDRVMDMPVSENGMTGVCIGAALNGFRPVLTHQRLDFALLSLDQIINNAAKWKSMFGAGQGVPLVIRMIIGRGWGQGAQHSQSLHALFAHIPGLKVLMPATPFDVKGMLLAALRQEDPVIFLEHRWLYSLRGEVPENDYEVPLGEARIVRTGNDLTLVSASHMTLEAARAASLLDAAGIQTELIDVRSLRPFDETLLLDSVKKTGRLLVADAGWRFCGFAAEMIALASEKAFDSLKQAPERITLPDFAMPSSPALAKYYYPLAEDIAVTAAKMCGKKIDIADPRETTTKWLDVPDLSFTGPF